MPEPNVYAGSTQLQYLKSILDTTQVRNDLVIPTTVLRLDGTDTGVPNTFGVMIQSPYFYMSNLLPQIFITLQPQTFMDDGFHTAFITTPFHIYYLMKYAENEQTILTLTERLEYIAKEVLKYRENNELWYSMSFPSIEPDNEVNQRFSESEEDYKIVAGRISFEVQHRGYWR